MPCIEMSVDHKYSCLLDITVVFTEGFAQLRKLPSSNSDSLFSTSTI